METEERIKRILEKQRIINRINELSEKQNDDLKRFMRLEKDLAPLRPLIKFIRDVPGSWFYLSICVVMIQFCVDIFIKLTILK